MAKNDDKTLFLYVGTYSSEEAAEEDYKSVKDLHGLGYIGSYDVGIVSKNDDGKLAVKRHTDSTGKGTKRGLAVGALIGVIFPPSILVSGAIGAGAGAAIGHSFNELSKDDMKEIGDYIQNNEAALVVIGESNIEEMLDKTETSALEEYKKEFSGELDPAIKQS